MAEHSQHVSARPKPFEFYTAKELWTDEHTSQEMLECHLNESVDISSRNKDFIDRSVKWIAAHFRVGANTVIADFGCGPGLYTTAFAEHGAAVTGIDFSSRSIRYAMETASQKGLSVEYVCHDYLAFESDKKFDLITMIMCDFCALSPTQRRTMLEKFKRLLQVDGSILLDVYSLSAFDQREEAATHEYAQSGGFWSSDPYHCYLNTFRYDEEKVILDKYTIVEAGRTRTVFNWLQYFSWESISKEFEEGGLQIRECFSDVAGTSFNPESPEFAVVAGRFR